ncbi:MAG: PilN domain-containing protein [Planctomycetota bacterium]
MLVNLLPSPIVLARARRLRRRTWTRGLLAYSIAILVAVLAVDGVLIEPTDALEAEAQSVESDIAASEARLELQSRVQTELEAEVAVLREIHGQPDWSIFVGHVSAARGSAVSIRSLRVSLVGGSSARITPGELARGPYRIEIGGVARSQSDVTEYIVRLERAGLLEDIRLRGTAPTRVGTDDAFTFSLEATISTTGGG